MDYWADQLRNASPGLGEVEHCRHEVGPRVRALNVDPRHARSNRTKVGLQVVEDVRRLYGRGSRFNVSTRRNALMIVYQRECVEVLRGPCDKPQQKQAAPAHDDQLISQAASLKGLPESLEHLTEIVSADVHGEKATYAKRESNILRCFIQRLAGR